MFPETRHFAIQSLHAQATKDAQEFVLEFPNQEISDIHSKWIIDKWLIYRWTPEVGSAIEILSYFVAWEVYRMQLGREVRRLNEEKSPNPRLN